MIYSKICHPASTMYLFVEEFLNLFNIYEALTGLLRATNLQHTATDLQFSQISHS